MKIEANIWNMKNGEIEAVKINDEIFKKVTKQQIEDELVKKIDKFYKNKSTKTKQIQNNKYKELLVKTKTCTECGRTKPLKYFYKRKDSRDGYNARCKKCIARYIRRRNQQKRLNILEKKCTGCKQTKHIKDFYKNKSTKDGYAYYCKECQIEYNKRYLDKKKHKDTTKKVLYESKPKTNKISSESNFPITNAEALRKKKWNMFRIKS